MPLQEDTVVALSTPWGESGIGVIRLSGPQCLDLAQAIFKKTSIVPRHNYFGRYQMLNGQLLDEVVFVYFAPQASFTGEATLEINCHGNPLILQSVIRDCIQRGCRQAEAGEFTRRAFMNGQMDLCQAEAVADLIHAKSLQALSIARNQLSGSLSQKLTQFTQTLTEQIAWIEAYLDFPEEDLPEENRQAYLSQLRGLLSDINVLINAHRYYQGVQNGLQTVIVGAPNAGKSTLLNTLLGHERAIVSDLPGTTRDFITEYIHLDPYTLRLTDTAGIRATGDLLERESIHRTVDQLRRADLIMWVVDQSQCMPSFEPEVIALLDPQKTLLVLNKVDLPQAADFTSLQDKYVHACISLKAPADSEALDKVRALIKHFLDQYYKNFSQEAFMIHERHAESLKCARVAIEKAVELFEHGGYEDCLAAELKTALRCFDQIVGKVDYEQVLDCIFSKFCIGK